MRSDEALAILNALDTHLRKTRSCGAELTITNTTTGGDVVAQLTVNYRGGGIDRYTSRFVAIYGKKPIVGSGKRASTALRNLAIELARAEGNTT